MRLSMISLSALMLAAATPAFADDTAPPPALTINGSATVVSDYRFRGISQTDKNFAIQGSITITHESGFYVSVWGSSVDDYVTMAGTGHQEMDLIAGFKKTYNGTTFDVGALYYVYPKTHPTSDISSSDFIEPYFDISHTFGPVTAKATVNYAPKQKALALDQGALGAASKKEDNVYLAGDFTAAIPKTPVSLSAHIGHTWGPSWLSIGKEYTDWGLGASIAYKSLTFGIQYVDTNGDFITPSGKNASKAGVVGSVGVSF
ncbi:MAG: TorF family putative porin [Pseudomonadota bacterium]